MKTLSLFILLTCLLPMSHSAQTNASLLRHVVLFSWNEDAPADTIAEIEAAFAALPSQIPEIAAFEWGTDASVEGLARGYTHCFLVSFKTADDRAAYLPHPAHQAFVQLMKPHMKSVLVFDYWQTGE
jgi:hypothetical protein